MGNTMRHTLRIVAAVCLLSFTSLASAKDWNTVRIGTEGAYPPFNYFDTDHQLQGFDVDIAKALCDHMKVDCEFVAQDWDGIIPALLAGKYDAIVASMAITDERKKQVDFTDKYYSSPPRFVVRKDSGITDVSPEGLKGKTLGAQSATTHANYLEAMYPDSEIKLYGSHDDLAMDLANGRLDAILAESIVVYQWMEKSEEGKCCEFVGEPLTDPAYFGYGAGIAVRQGDQDLKAMLNEALAAILADGTYQKINDKYFPFSVY
jgi:polar amino acid transport system substrate-binding protein